MIFLPIGKWFERRGLTRAISSLLCVFIFIIAACTMVLVFSGQVSNLAQDVTGMHERTTHIMGDIRQYVSNSLGMHEDRLVVSPEQQQAESALNAKKMVTVIMSSVMDVLSVTALIVVYLFLFMFFRIHIKNFVLKLAPIPGRIKTERMMQNASRVAQQYLTGMGMMVIILFVLYYIGYSIIGLKYAIFFAIFCALIQLVPLIGNVTGTLLTIVLAFLQGAGINMVIGIIITYSIIQFIQLYLLEPVIIESEVNINPLFIILVLIAGEMIWGIPGLVLALPILGILKIFCDNLEPLQPIGFLIGGEKRIKKDSKLIRRLSNWFNKKDKEDLRYNEQ